MNRFRLNDTKDLHWQGVPSPSSNDDDNMRYSIPHQMTPTSPKSTKRQLSPGTPERPIAIPDTACEGTPDEPIWVSDVEDDSETNVSNVAIRGVRKSELMLGKAKPKPPSEKMKRSKSNEKKFAAEPLDDFASTQALKTRSALLGNARRTIPEETETKPAISLSSSEAPTDQGVKKAPSKEKKSTAKKIIKSMSIKPSKKIASPSIDVASLAKEEDPVLEQELEEIALNWQGGGISGTPSAHDIEKGKRKGNSVLSIIPPNASLAEDEADRSWHNGISDQKPKRNKRQTLYLFLSIAGLIVITSCLIFVSSGKGKSETVVKEKEEPLLTPRQQKMQNLIERVTDSSILRDPKSPQHLARSWLLFTDEGFDSAEESMVIQRYVLACFYFSTGGDSKWSRNNWLSGDECDEEQPWNGLGCTPDGEVQAIVLDNEGLDGTIPLEMGHLLNLEHFILKNNPGLHGWIPTTLGHLASLDQLGLYNNALSGTIPNIFEHAKQIRYVNLEDNHLYGSIPRGIRRLASLDTLALANNKLDGIVPIADLAQTTIKYLSLSRNGFSSMLDHSIEEMTTIEHLYLDHNKLKGPIPAEIVALTNLKSLDLGSNQLSGTVPTEVGNLVRLEFLALDRNKLDGPAPRELSKLTNLKSLNMASNELEGPLPDISNMSKLVNLQLFENSFTGTIPESLQKLENIEVLLLSSNKIAGTIPRGISRLSRTLRGLYLSDNAIRGRIPTELCQLESLQALFLDTNELFGPIPACLGNLTELQQLYFFQNQLSGQVPTTFGQLSLLNGLGLEENSLTGEMPDKVCSLVDNSGLDIWADCTDQFGSDPLLCNCCSVCCPSGDCQ